MNEFISRKEAIAYIREQSEERQKAFEELGGESGIYADAYNDLAEDFYSIPAADAQGIKERIAMDIERYGDCKVVSIVSDRKYEQIGMRGERK